MVFEGEPTIGMPAPELISVTLTFKPMTQFLMRVQGIYYVWVTVQIPSVLHEIGWSSLQVFHGPRWVILIDDPVTVIQLKMLSVPRGPGSE